MVSAIQTFLLVFSSVLIYGIGIPRLYQHYHLVPFTSLFGKTKQLDVEMNWGSIGWIVAVLSLPFLLLSIIMIKRFNLKIVYIRLNEDP